MLDLDAGDLKHDVDFRVLYAAALRWLGLAPQRVLGRDFTGTHPLR